jgi:acyl-CoA synthetase (AMP-forming)/AMP-acid ligase II
MTGNIKVAAPHSSTADDPEPAREHIAELLLARREDCTPGQFSFVTELGVREFSYADLHASALAVAVEIQERDPGSDTVLMCPGNTFDFVRTFFGCLYAGKIAVPAYPPAQSETSRRHLAAIAADCGARIVVHSARRAGAAREAELLPGDCRTIELTSIAPRTTRGDVTLRNAAAYLQYTSGSTGSPRGVVITHDNVRQNCSSIRQWCNGSSADISLSWLPLFHDMGLVFHLLYPLTLGMRCVFLAPMSFMQRPLAWLEAISKYRATFSGAPNFAFEQCVRRAGYAGTHLDLGSWRVAYAAAEPNRAPTLREFADIYARHGFRRSALKPAYGLAENTLIATGVSSSESMRIAAYVAQDLRDGVARPAADREPATELVGCGRPVRGVRLRIVDPEHKTAQPERRVGEVWLSGACVADGYWRNPQTTATFNARIHEDASCNDYLRTGDLGFIDDGHLYVVGRIKDVMIVRGRKFYPQDIEQCASSSHTGCLPSAAIAFSVDDPSRRDEMIVVVQEIERSFVHRVRADQDAAEEIARCIRGRIFDEFALRVTDVVLLAPFRLPKTTSGKVMRRRTRQLYMDGALAAEWSALNDARANPEPNSTIVGEDSL